MEVDEIVFSTNYNCPSRTEGATIAVDATTLKVAGESDTSLQRLGITGKSAGLSGQRLEWGIDGHLDDRTPVVQFVTR